MSTQHHVVQSEEDSRFSFCNDSSGITEEDLVRVRKLMGASHEYHYSDRYAAITRSQKMHMYRQEMMAQVERMPEGTYELSLRDIVELPKANEVQSRTEKVEASGIVATATVQKKRNMVNKWKDVLGTKGSVSGVFMLKMFYPSHLNGRRKSGVVGSKVSPKPILSPREKSTSFGSEEMCRSSSGKSKIMEKMSGCYFFMGSNRGHRTSEFET